MNGFPGIDIIERPDKPRDEGITMMIDWGLGLGQLADLLDQAGAYVDIAKIAVGTAALIPQELLAEKIRLYAHRGVTASPGGQFLEYAYTQGRAAAFFESCQRAGFSCVEVSTNEVDIDPGEKARLIRAAVDDYGFKVLGETGSKHAASTPETLVADARNMLDAGAWKIFVEAAECFVDGVFQRRVIDHLIRDQLDDGSDPGNTCPDGPVDQPSPPAECVGQGGLNDGDETPAMQANNTVTVTAFLTVLP